MPTGFAEDVFVGRSEDLDRLAHLLRTARDGSGGLLLVSGEPGMGKTRFAEEASGMAREAGMAVAWGQCWEAEAAPPYLPWTQVLHQLAAAAPEVRLPDWQIRSDERASRFEFFEEAMEALRAVAARVSALIVLDDLQWADGASLHLLQYAAPLLPSLRVRVLATCREHEEAGELAAILPNIERQRGVRRLPLQPLPAKEGDELARRWLRRHVDQNTLDSIRLRAEGNPLFIRELAKLIAGPGGSASTLPRTVREVIQRQLRSLGSPARAALREAAVLGVEFEVRLLSGIAGRSQAELSSVLLEAARRGLLAGDQGKWRFTHGLIREVFYSELSAEDSAHLHAEVARALERTRSEAGVPHPEAIAHHLRQAVALIGAGPALAATIEAADAAELAFAHEDGAVQLAHAVRLAPGAGMDAVRRRALLLRLAGCRFRAGAIEEAWDACRAVAAEARSAGDWSTVAEAATLIRGVAVGGIAAEIDSFCVEALAGLPDSDLGHRAKLLAQRVLIADPWALARDESLGTSALLAAESSGDPDARFMALQARRQELLPPQYCLERLSAGDRALRLAVESGRGEYAFWGHAWRLGALWELGRRDQVDTALAALTSVVDRLREPLHRWRLRLIEAALMRMEGRFAEGRALLDTALEIGRAVGHQEAEVADRVARIMLWRQAGGGDEAVRLLVRSNRPITSAGFFAKLWEGVLLADADRLEELRALWPIIVERFAVFPPNITWIDTATAMATMCCQVEDRVYAASLYATLLPFADRQAVGDPASGSQGPVALYLGNLAGLLGQWEEAERLLHRAIAGSQDLVSPPYEAIARHDLAAMWLARGRPRDRAAAMREINKAEAIASRLGMRPLQARIGRLSATVRATHAAGRLSVREFEVARLVAEGLSNHAIAQRLHLSSRTAENHVQHILVKLGFDSRAQIAAWFAAGKN